MRRNDLLRVQMQTLERFAQFDPKMQLSTALSLLYIARYQDRPEGVTTGDLTKWIGLTPAAASRNSYYWAEGSVDMPGSGYGLVSIVVDPLDRRKRLLRLTARGEAFVRQIGELMPNISFDQEELIESVTHH